jgi:uncharacterized protein YtpQ (UPF0354 family)
MPTFLRRLAFLSLLLAAAAVQAATPMSRDEFTRAYIQAVLVRAGPSAQVAPAANNGLDITLPGGKTLTAYLDNAYKLYLDDPGSLQLVLDRYVASLLETAAMPETLDRTRIIAVVKSRTWLDEMAATMSARGSKTEPHVYEREPLADGLWIVYAEDTPRNIRYFTADELRAAGVERQDLRALALRNLKQLLVSRVEVERGTISMVTAGGDYEASLLLLDEVWARPDLRAKGEIVVAVPARDLLLVADSADIVAIDKLRLLAMRLHDKASHPLSDQLFVYRGGRFVRYERVPSAR